MSEFNSNGIYIPKPRIPPPTILYRSYGMISEEELCAAKKHFVSFNSRMKVGSGELVIGRYSVLPFYKELEEDLACKGSKLINSYHQHRYVADLSSYVPDLEDLTFRTWNAKELPYLPENIPFILKGETNSKKDLWNTHMFARNKQKAIEVFANLTKDNMIGQQEIYIREYVPLLHLLENNLGPPVSLEFRFFVAYGEIISGGFYWSNHLDELVTIPSVSEVPKDFLTKVIDRVKDKVNFFVVDVAKTQSGDWVVVELNDAQMSGLSENNPEVLYKNLKYLTWDRYNVKHNL